MKASDLIKAKYYLNQKLKDDGTLYGGTANNSETLRDFLEEAYEQIDLGVDEIDDIGELEMSEVNYMLARCGIEPIDYQFKREREQFAVMIAMNYGYFTSDDRLATISRIVDFANTYDFDLQLDDDEWVINTEIAREVAYQFANELLKTTEKEFRDYEDRLGERIQR